MGGLIWRLRTAGNGPRLGLFRGDLGYILLAGGAAALLIAAALMSSIQVATAFTMAWPCIGNFRVWEGGRPHERLWIDDTKPPLKKA